MPVPDPLPAAPGADAGLAAAAAALGRQARADRAPLDAMLPRVEQLAVAAARELPERNALLLLLWRTARHAYEAA